MSENNILYLIPIYLNTYRKNMQQFLNELVKPYGLTSFHAPFLRKLNEGPLRLKELGEYMGVCRASTTRVVNALKEGGFAYDDSKDGRSRKYCIHLTAEGKALAEEIESGVNAFLDRRFSRLTADERDEFFRLLDKLANDK